jgi:proteasome lid subunit RPN8/RPN11
MISLTRDLVRSVLAHLESEYPLEGCGLLFGTRDGDEAIATWYAGIRNADTTRQPDWFEMDPKAVWWADTDARRAGLSMLAVVHSHPNHPARPSARDLERAWPGLVYLIASVRDGRAAEWTCWTLDETGQAFRPVIVRMRRDGAALTRPAVLYESREPRPLPPPVVE